MVVETEYNEMRWYQCELCGFMLENSDDAQQHEDNCDAEEPDYYQ